MKVSDFLKAISIITDSGFSRPTTKFNLTKFSYKNGIMKVQLYQYKCVQYVNMLCTKGSLVSTC